MTTTTITIDSLNPQVFTDTIGYTAHDEQKRTWNLVYADGRIGCEIIDCYEFELVCLVGHKFHHRDPASPGRVLGVSDLPSHPTDVSGYSKHLQGRPAGRRNFDVEPPARLGARPNLEVM